MLYIYHGTNVAAAGAKARGLVESLRKKRPDAAYQRIEADAWDAAAVRGHLGGQGLFSAKYIIYLDRVTDNADAKAELSDMLGAMHESDNIFVVLEGKLNADLRRAAEKYADKAVDCDGAGGLGSPRRGTNGEVAAAVGATASEPNVFGIASALGARDAYRAWRLYREAVDAGTAAENIIGILFWKAKSAGDLALARDLVVLYHEGHRGRVDLELATERLLLSCGGEKSR